MNLENVLDCDSETRKRFRLSWKALKTGGYRYLDRLNIVAAEAYLFGRA